MSQRKLRWGEWLLQKGIFLAALVSVVTTAGIVYVLVTEAATFFQHYSLFRFLFGTKWSSLAPPSYGVLPLLCGTLLVTVGAAIVAIPIGLGSAIFMSEYATPRIRSIVKPVLEVLAGIPSIVYGFFALTSVTPLLKHFLPQTQTFNAASAAIVVGIMVLPMVASLCDDALRAVPNSLRYAGLALGATKFEVSAKVVVPAALSGIFASFVLAISRAIGETMAVALAAGATPKLTLNPLESIQTMTAYIVQAANGEAVQGSIEYRTIFAVGLLLFVFTFGLNVLSHRVLRKYREVYE